MIFALANILILLLFLCHNWNENLKKKIETTNNKNGFFVPAITYDNTDTLKLQILRDNKGKAGI